MSLRKYSIALLKCLEASTIDNAAANNQVVKTSKDEMKPPEFNQLIQKHYHHQKQHHLKVTNNQYNQLSQQENLLEHHQFNNHLPQLRRKIMPSDLALLSLLRQNRKTFPQQLEKKPHLEEDMDKPSQLTRETIFLLILTKQRPSNSRITHIPNNSMQSLSSSNISNNKSLQLLIKLQNNSNTFSHLHKVARSL